MQYVEVNVMALAILTLLIVASVTDRTGDMGIRSRNYYLAMTVCVFVSLTADTIISAMSAAADPANTLVLTVVSTVYFFMHPLFGLLWMAYCWSKVSDRPGMAIKVPVLVLLAPCIVCWAVIASSPWTGWAFVVDAAGTYARGPLLDAVVGVSFIYWFASVAIIIDDARRKTPARGRYFYWSTLLFPLPILFGALAQMLLFGLSIVWPAAAFSLLVQYIFVQSRVLVAQELLFARLIQSGEAAFMQIAGDTGRVNYVSANMRSRFGIDVKEGMSSADYAVARLFPQADELIESLRQWDGAQCFTSDYIRYQNPSDPSAEHWCRVIMRPQEDRALVITVQDVTKAKQDEGELRAARARADESNAAKSRLLASLSHDMRTPLNAIVGMASLAARDAGNTEVVANALETVSVSADNLLELINRILDASRATSSEASLEPVEFSLPDLLEEIDAVFVPLTKGRDQVYTRSQLGPTATSTRYMADASKIRRVLSNLLTNAVKYTPHGGSIGLDVDFVSRGTNGADIYAFTVRDTGEGISPDKVHSIFEPFVRDVKENNTKVEGVGLGLSIVKGFVEAMDGALDVVSTLGEGSTFVAVIPLRPVDGPADETPTPLQFSLDGSRVLVAEDNPVNQAILKALLEGKGACVDTVGDGEQCVKRYADQGPYDLVLMDVQMPVMGGHQATAALRASGASGAATVPVVALTGDVSCSDVLAARLAGMDAHVGKPVEIDAIAHVAYELRVGSFA